MRVVIVGAGQHALVVLYNLRSQGKYQCVGFSAGHQHEVGKVTAGLEVLGLHEDMRVIAKQHSICGYILGFGNLETRAVLARYYEIELGLEPVSVIHPHALVAPDAQIGRGTLVEAGCLLTPNPIVGDHCIVNTMSNINHDNTLASNVHIASGVTLSGGVSIGRNTLIDDGVTIALGKSVGAHTIIGAGSVVTRDIPDNSVAYGVPARVVRTRQ